MNFNAPARALSFGTIRGRAALPGLLLLLLAGCAAGGPAAPGAPAAATPAPRDALGRFLAGAAPGQQGSVTLEDGRTTRVRVVRAYAAASGRQCREVLLGEGVGGRASLLCEAEGNWVAARPLLLGSSARP
ncbi:DVU3141 family protein [Paracraurococcus ruber]|nr:DVU3141 family protein [Paracraurococcus ruber]